MSKLGTVAPGGVGAADGGSPACGGMGGTTRGGGAPLLHRMNANPAITTPAPMSPIHNRRTDLPPGLFGCGASVCGGEAACNPAPFG
jgi:hypothetical protein